MRSFRTFIAIFAIAWRRLWAKRGLALASALGFVMAVALAYTLPLYADSVYQRILNRDINSRASAYGGAGSRIPPFRFTFRYDSWENYPSADKLLMTWAPRIIGLPLQTTTRYFQTDSFRVFAFDTLTSTQVAQPLFWAPIVSIDHFADHISFVDGQMADDATLAAPTNQSPADPDIQQLKNKPEIKVIVSQTLAKDMGLNLGDRLVLVSKQDFRSAVKQPVYIAGIWIPRDPSDPYWGDYSWDVMQKMIFISRNSFLLLAPAMKSELSQVSWNLDFQGIQMHVWDVPNFVGRIKALQRLLQQQQLPISIGYSPQARLLAYQSQSRVLTEQLYAFSMPVFVLVFAFLILVAGLMTNDQRNEIAVLRSRGAAAAQVFGISLLEALVLGAIGVLLAVPVAIGIAEVLGQTRSFMTFTGTEWLTASDWLSALMAGTPLVASVVPPGLLVAGVAIVITVLPVLSATRHTIITYKQEQARAMMKPLWQRAWFDLLLLIPAGYWTYLLLKQDAVTIPGLGAGVVGSTATTDPFSNPAMFLVPALAMLALTLLFIRLVPLIMRLLSWLLAKLPGVTLVLAMRQLARSPSLYVVPMFLLMLTLALATFTSSVASTLDANLIQQTRYSVGGDVLLKQTGEQGGSTLPSEDVTANSSSSGSTSGMSIGNIGVQVGDSSSSTQASSAAAPPVNTGPQYDFLPISQYLQVPQVQAATRVGRYPATFHFGGGGDVQGYVEGIDRLDFPRVAFWRDDFATKSLGALMNDLAINSDGVLVPASVMRQYGLSVGDRIPVSMFFSGEKIDASLKVVGSFNLWPTWYPDNSSDGPLFVGNLDYLFEEAQGQFPYDVWIKVDAGADPSLIAPRVRALGQQAYASDVRTIIEQQLNRPERQGLFGVLTIGFLAAAIFTALGFALYAVFSLRRRTIELGILRAIGLSGTQMSTFVGWELVLVLLLGAAGGTALGIAASQLYIPFLQANDVQQALPFQVMINWTQVGVIYVLFGALFSVVLAGLAAFLRQLHIFQAIKMGETQ